VIPIFKTFLSGGKKEGRSESLLSRKKVGVFFPRITARLNCAFSLTILGTQLFWRLSAEERIFTHAQLRRSGPLCGRSVQDERIAKAINFGIIYGMGPQTLSEGLGIDLKSAKEYISAYYRKYQGVTRYRDTSIQSARERGYVTTLFNRRRYLPDILHENRVIRAEAERMAINTPIQGTAADLIKKAMIRIHDRLKKEKSKRCSFRCMMSSFLRSLKRRSAPLGPW
jgi:hypothetical protein